MDDDEPCDGTCGARGCDPHVCFECGRQKRPEDDVCEACYLDALDCLNCGMCEWCIERSIAAAEENTPPDDVDSVEALYREHGEAGA